MRPVAFEATTSSVSSWRSYRLSYGRSTPDGIRTRVTAMRGRHPRPLDDQGSSGGWI